MYLEPFFHTTAVKSAGKYIYIYIYHPCRTRLLSFRILSMKNIRRILFRAFLRVQIPSFTLVLTLIAGKLTHTHKRASSSGQAILSVVTCTRNPLSRYTDQAMGCRTGESRFSAASISLQRVRLGREVDHSPPACVEVRVVG
jgi:hypothetical protein